MPGKTKTDPEMLTFQTNLMEAVRDTKAGHAVHVTKVALSDAADARANIRADGYPSPSCTAGQTPNTICGPEQ